MLRTSKFLLSMIAVLVVVTGCSTNSSTDTDTDIDTGAAADTNTTYNDGAADTSNTTTTVSSDPRDALLGVDTVFYFDFDQSLLKTESRTALLIHASVIRELNSSVRIEGHADERGSREYNMALGERRANAVRDFLVLQGVPSYLIEAVSYGEERPAEVGSNASTWSKNRRAEIKY